MLHSLTWVSAPLLWCWGVSFSCHAQSRSLAIKTGSIEFLRECLHKPRTSMQTLGTHCQVKVPPTTSQNKLSKVLPRSVVAGLAKHEQDLSFTLLKMAKAYTKHFEERVPLRRRGRL